MRKIPSKILENAVDEISKLPGIGRRSALRLALWILKQDTVNIENLGNSIINLRKDVNYCKTCFNISETNTCDICNDTSRQKELICVVQDIRDVMAIEHTGEYNGLYHILGGVISPIEGISPSDLTIDPLIKRVFNEEISEIIMALNPTVEGDTTVFYIYRKIKEIDIKVSSIARGIAVGDELEYADEVTLGRSIVNRVPYDNSFKTDH